MCFYFREKGENKTVMAVFDGKYILNELPTSVMEAFRREGVENPFYNADLEKALKIER